MCQSNIDDPVLMLDKCSMSFSTRYHIKVQSESAVRLVHIKDANLPILLQFGCVEASGCYVTCAKQVRESTSIKVPRYITVKSMHAACTAYYFISYLRAEEIQTAAALGDEYNMWTTWIQYFECYRMAALHTAELIAITCRSKDPQNHSPVKP